MEEVRHSIQAVLGRFGYQIRRISPPRLAKPAVDRGMVRIDPVWPLPRSSKLSIGEIDAEFGRYDSWHYAYEFEGGLSFPIRSACPGPLTLAADRPHQRFRHFMPDLIGAHNGSLSGKRILDIACNSGFWTIQCALLGANVVGFDARPELIAQANLIKSIVGTQKAEFRLLDFWEMSPELLDGQFDIVLNLGILYHLPEPLNVLKLTAAMTRPGGYILLDTEVYPSTDAAIQLRWEEPDTIRSANRSGIVALPSQSSVDLMLKDIGAAKWFEIPLRSVDMPQDYLEYRRVSWLIKM